MNTAPSAAAELSIKGSFFPNSKYGSFSGTYSVDNNASFTGSSDFIVFPSWNINLFSPLDIQVAKISYSKPGSRGEIIQSVNSLTGKPLSILFFEEPEFEPIPWRVLDLEFSPGLATPQSIPVGFLNMSGGLVENNNTSNPPEFGVSAVTVTSTPVPGPSSTLGLLAVGAFGAGSLLKRQQKK